MNKISLLLAVLILGTGPGVGAQTFSGIAEVGCGQCQFQMKKTGCDLAVRINGKAYFVDGSGIDDHGDAHGPDGMCSRIRKAKVTGRVAGDRFQVESLQLLPMSPNP